MERATVGFLSGLAGGIIIGIISTALNKIGICKICLVVLGGGLFQQQFFNASDLGWSILGWIAHLVLSASLGIAIAYILFYFGEKFAILKGAFFGSIVWYLLINQQFGQTGEPGRLTYSLY